MEIIKIKYIHNTFKKRKLTTWLLGGTLRMGGDLGLNGRTANGPVSYEKKNI